MFLPETPEQQQKRRFSSTCSFFNVYTLVVSSEWLLGRASHKFQNLWHSPLSPPRPTRYPPPPSPMQEMQAAAASAATGIFKAPTGLFRIRGHIFGNKSWWNYTFLNLTCGCLMLTRVFMFLDPDFLFNSYILNQSWNL